MAEQGRFESGGVGDRRQNGRFATVPSVSTGVLPARWPFTHTGGQSRPYLYKPTELDVRPDGQMGREGRG